MTACSVQHVDVGGRRGGVDEHAGRAGEHRRQHVGVQRGDVVEREQHGGDVVGAELQHPLVAHRRVHRRPVHHLRRLGPPGRAAGEDDGVGRPPRPAPPTRRRAPARRARRRGRAAPGSGKRGSASRSRTCMCSHHVAPTARGASRVLSPTATSRARAQANSRTGELQAVAGRHGDRVARAAARGRRSARAPRLDPRGEPGVGRAAARRRRTRSRRASGRTARSRTASTVGGPAGVGQRGRAEPALLDDGVAGPVVEVVGRGRHGDQPAARPVREGSGAAAGERLRSASRSASATSVGEVGDLERRARATAGWTLTACSAS